MNEMKGWANEVKKEEELSFAIVAANNHYVGFGLATANTFRTMVGLPAVSYEELKQTKLS